MTSINSNILKQFIESKFNSTKINMQQAQQYDIDNETFLETDVSKDFFIDVDEIMDNTDLYEQFATMYVNEMKKNDDLDEEKEKQKNESVQGTDSAGM